MAKIYTCVYRIYVNMSLPSVKLVRKCIQSLLLEVMIGIIHLGLFSTPIIIISLVAIYAMTHSIWFALYCVCVYRLLWSSGAELFRRWDKTTPIERRELICLVTINIIAILMLPQIARLQGIRFVWW